MQYFGRPKLWLPSHLDLGAQRAPTLILRKSCYLHRFVRLAQISVFRNLSRIIAELRSASLRSF